MLKGYIRFKMNRIFLNRAIRRANRLHCETGLRYRVFFFGYKYYAWSRKDIQERKHINLFHRHKRVGDDFDSIAFYDTNSLTDKK